MINLAATLNQKNLEEDYAEILMPEHFKDRVKWDDKINWREIMSLKKKEFQAFSEDEGACVTEDAGKKDVSQSKMNSDSKSGSKSTIGQLKAQDLRKMIFNAKQHVKKFNALMAEANPRLKDRVVWEVYVGRSRVSEEVSKMNHWRSERFGPWDFSRTEDRKHFLRRLAAEEPDDILLGTTYRFWSPMQGITANRSPGAKQYLVDARKEDHDVHLMFVATVFQLQQRNGRHATIEHPWNSRAWKTRVWSALHGFATYLHQCSLGLEMEDDSGVVPVKKPTCLLTTKQFLYEVMCNDQHGHNPLEGDISGRGSRTKLAEDYSAGMAKELAGVSHRMNFPEQRLKEVTHWFQHLMISSLATEKEVT